MWRRDFRAGYRLRSVLSHPSAMKLRMDGAPTRSSNTKIGPTTFQWLQVAPPKSEASASNASRHGGRIVAMVYETTFEVFTRIRPDNSLERLTERSVGLVTDRPSDVYKLFVTLFK